MLQEDRFLQIVKYLHEKQTATLEELAKLTDVSTGTARRDLYKLQESGVLSVVRGGAVFRSNDLTKQEFDVRGIENRQEKRSLTHLLPQIISDGQSIAINSGTTNLEVARFLATHYRRLTVVTNNLRIVEILKAGDHFTLIVPGGILDTKEHSIIGRSCESQTLSYNVDTALLAVNGLSDEKGATDFRRGEVGVAQAMLKVAKTRVIVADYTKFDRVSYMNVCGLSEIDYILSDCRVTEEQLSRYRSRGIQVLVPEAEGGAL